MTSFAPSLLEKVLIAYARRFPIRKGKLRVVDRLWRPIARDHETTRLAHLRYGGFTMPCDLAEMLQRQLYFFGTYFLEERLLDCWADFAEDARVVFDVGANAGIYSLVALAQKPGVVVHAFEPTPEIARRLRETVQLNGLKNLFVHEAAVSDRSARMELRRERGELGTNEGMNYIVEKTGAPGAELVSTVSLDEFCQEHGISSIDLLKLDVQGNEYAVLHGARSLLSQGRITTIFMELNWAGASDAICPATQSIQLLKQAGYRFADAAEGRSWQNAGPWLRSLSDVMARRVEDH